MKLYHYMDECYGLINLENRRLKASTFNRLNDPFELLGIEASDLLIRNALKETKRRISYNFGVLCFSKIWSNPVQWAHYANHYKGLCLEIELSGRCNAQKVDYVPERLDSSAISSSKFSEKLLLTKFEHWGYEEEYRIIRRLDNFIKEDGLYFQPFNDDIKITKVIIGCQSNIIRNDVLERLSDADKNVEVIYSRSAFKSFKIVEHKNK